VAAVEVPAGWSEADRESGRVAAGHARGQTQSVGTVEVEPLLVFEFVAQTACAGEDLDTTGEKDIVHIAAVGTVQDSAAAALAALA